MPPSNLTPSLQILREDYVLIQAWKKTTRYIRSHNSFADILDLDLTEIDLPRFISRLKEHLADPADWQSRPIRMVLAPKAKCRILTQESETAEPCRLRPLAHLALRDQVAATAVMLCLADRVETAQGDPRIQVSAKTPGAMRPISYGNRLFCDWIEKTESLRHRWGSSVLYRGYFEDYKKFITRPTTIATHLESGESNSIFIIHTDLKGFYDRISPSLLNAAINQQLGSGSDDGFRTLIKKLFCWHWHSKDVKLAKRYGKSNQIESFESVALPQGLVSAGFFSNLIMLQLDDRLRSLIDEDILAGVTLVDACRYVDDFRFVISVDTEVTDTARLLNTFTRWLQEQLDIIERSLESDCSSFLISKGKSQIANVTNADEPIIHQSQRMNQIQQDASGGFDANQGIQILTAVEALIGSQRRFSRLEGTKRWAWLPLPDTEDGTVKRFAAGRYRRTFRSIRPLLEDFSGPDPDERDTVSKAVTTPRSTDERSQLDQDAKHFAYALIEDWISDASNVRILRIALDLWPSPQLLEHVLKSIKPLLDDDQDQARTKRMVACYCLSEIFRAATIETGCVSDEELLPDEINLDSYRSSLYEEALRLAKTEGMALPWYVREPLLMFVAAYSGPANGIEREFISRFRSHYRRLFAFISGDYGHFPKRRFVKYFALVRHCLPETYASIYPTLEAQIRRSHLRLIAENNPSFAIELIERDPRLNAFLKDTHFLDDLCLKPIKTSINSKCNSLAEIVGRAKELHPLQNELALLQFSLRFLKALDSQERYAQIRPTEVFIKVGNDSGDIEHVELNISTHSGASFMSIYRPPHWCEPADRWRFHLGFLLRYLLTNSADFTRSRNLSKVEWPLQIYRKAAHHWYHRLHGLYNRQAGLGEDWLPISPWIESFLYRLLAWPGSGGSVGDSVVTFTRSDALQTLKERLRVLQNMRGKSTNVLVLPVSVPFPYKPRNVLRACIVQTVFPTLEALKKDETLAQKNLRRIHKNHLATALATVGKMLDWRDLDQTSRHKLDLLIFPELAVNYADVQTHLKDFALRHKTIIVAGVSYRPHSPHAGQELFNSGIWVIPYQTAAGGRDILIRSQGKCNLAPEEESVFGKKVRGFRPCQWLVDYDWSTSASDLPLRLTASICYDATDLGLAADLRNVSDIFIVPAFNKDVETFDNLATQLHYNMYQMVAIANSGVYGGSCVFWPRKASYERRVFHCHGDDQCTIGFFDVDIPELLQRKGERKSDLWKSPPAGII